MTKQPVNFRLSTETLQQLDSLIAEGYATSRTAVIERLAQEAANREAVERRQALVIIKEQAGHFIKLVSEIK